MGPPPIKGPLWTKAIALFLAELDLAMFIIALGLFYATYTLQQA